MAEAKTSTKLDTDSGGDLRMRLDKSKGLNKKERQELVDLLRKNMIYQTPRPIFSGQDDDHPSHVQMTFVFAHQQRILQLLHKAGGWVLPIEERKKILVKHEEAARVAYGDGVDYDLTHLGYGDLVQMYRELEGIEEMSDFRSAIAEALQDWQGVTHG